MTAAETETPAPYQCGDEIAPGYRVIKHMARGVDLDSYDAWSEARYSRCFLKTPRPDRLDDADTVHQLRTEAELLLSFTHPHLVRAYEFVEPADCRPPVLVLETLTGSTLDYLLDAGGRLATRDLAYLGQHLCAGLRYLHDQGYLHLDIKPRNIIANEGTARIIDLSLARRPGPQEGGHGTPAAMAPEQARGGLLGAAADVWGLGLVLYEAATGANPFDEEDTAEDGSGSGGDADLDYPQLDVRAPSVLTQRHLPRSFADAIDRCLEPDPERRPSLSELDVVFTSVTGDDRPQSLLVDG